MSCQAYKSKQQSSFLPSLKRGQGISINILSDPLTLDPRKAFLLRDINLSKMFMDGLMREKGDEILPAIAKSYKISEDGRVYTFFLREAFWTNGDPVVASDFVYSWKKSLAQDFMSKMSFLLFAIKNAHSIKSGKLPVSALGAIAQDDETLIVILERPLLHFLELLTFPVFFPINRKIDQENEKWHVHVDSFVSNGPFRLDSWIRNNYMIAKKNQQYWDSCSVRLSSIHMFMVSADIGMKMLSCGELDWEGSPFSIIPLDLLDRFQKLYSFVVVPSLGTMYLRINGKDPFLKRKSFRKALAHAIDREEMTKNLFQGFLQPAYSFVPPFFCLHEKLPLLNEGRFEKMKHFLERELKMEGYHIEDIPPFTLLIGNEPRNNYLVALTMIEQWKKNLGIRVNLEIVENKMAISRYVDEQFQLGLGGWFADYRDPMNFLEIFYEKHAPVNIANWENVDYQKTIEDSYACANKRDWEKRKTKLCESEMILMEDLPLIPLLHFSIIYAKNNNVKDVFVTEKGGIDFKWAYLSS